MAMVADCGTQEDIEKFYYLVGCCKGDALEAIRGIPVSENNYALAWSTLQARFDKPRLVACSHIDKLLNAPKATTETLLDLNKFLVIFDEGVAVLDSMKIPNLGDFILFSPASRCLPTYCIKLFEAQSVHGFPTVRDLLSFLKARVAVLECIPQGGIKEQLSHARDTVHKHATIRKVSKGSSYNAKGPIHTSMVTSSGSSHTSQSCKCCGGSHGLTSCSKFKGWTLEARNSWAREQRICFRCLRTGHWASDCKSSVVCTQCSRRHHSLLHTDVPVGRTRGENTSSDNRAEAVASSLVGRHNSPSVVLGTALVHMPDSTGVLHTVRALIDSASQISAITAECCSRLGLRIKRWTASVSGLTGVSINTVSGLVSCQAQPRFSLEPVLKFDAWVFPSITDNMPRSPLPHSLADRYQHLALADPYFTQSSTIDVLLGADLFAKILNGKRVTVGKEYPVAFGATVFGWTVIGSIPDSEHPISISCPISLVTSVESMLERFWELEEPDAAPAEFTHDGECDALFREGCVRDSDGRFSVPLLFRQTVSESTFRGSRAVAKKRFEQLERKLLSDDCLRKSYHDFVSEYLSLGHMSPATSSGEYLIPHHAVYRPGDANSKIRVVFDASASSYSGTSLNDCLFPGPKLQRDVIEVLLLYRVHRYSFTTDISKMYRQVLVSPQHRRFQHILWRSSPDEELREYELNTVTYGVNCAPYLALRVLQCIAEQECNTCPLVREALLYSTYVDDICTGSDTIEEIISLQADLVKTLHRAGMTLKKWASNTTEVLDRVSVEDHVCVPLSFDDSSSGGTKVLGLQWSQRDDTFTYSFHPESHVSTKRGMLSMIARMFDPLGLLSPVTFFAKSLMQRVWKASLSWDEQLPHDIAEPWHQFVRDLPTLQNVRIPRFIGTHRDMNCSLCGFSDASSLGYAAVIYIRVIDSSGRPTVSLIGAKTKMAPLKPSTIPRLELCAALLLARWMARVKDTLSLKLHVTDIYAWSDSTTVLSWLKCPHESFKIFVSNRIHRIHTLLPACQCHYIESSHNPADCCSRGILPSNLIENKLYLNGPPCLYLPAQQWDLETPVISIDQLPEVKGVVPTTLAVQIKEREWFECYSSYLQAVRVTARMLLPVSRRAGSCGDVDRSLLATDPYWRVGSGVDPWARCLVAFISSSSSVYR